MGKFRHTAALPCSLVIVSEKPFHDNSPVRNAASAAMLLCVLAYLHFNTVIKLWVHHISAKINDLVTAGVPLFSPLETCLLHIPLF